MKAIEFIQKRASGILTVVACVGVVVTAALTHRAALKAQTESDAKSKAKHYILPTVAGAGTMTAMIMSNRIDKKDIAMVAGAAAATAKRYDDYRKANVEVNGMEAHKKVVERLNAQTAACAHITSESFMDIYSLNSEIDDNDRVFHDTITGEYFVSSLSRVIDAEYHLNRNFTSGHPEVNVQMWCDFLGIENRHHDERGWALVDDLSWLDFNNSIFTVVHGVPIIEITPCVQPILGYEDVDYYYM